MYELRIQKNRIRAQFLERRTSLSEDERHRRDLKICSLFTSLVTYRYSGILLLYVPTRSEINILSIARQALEDGKKIAFPCCEPNGRNMEFRMVSSLDELIERDSFGIPEPSRKCLLYDRNDTKIPAVCIVPAIVYDRHGYRIGYGKGYYDRYLPSFSGTKVGFVYSDFIVPSLPRGRYDIAVDVLVTEKGVKALNTV